GTEVYRFNPASSDPFSLGSASYTTYRYRSGAWTPSAPVANVGEPLWVKTGLSYQNTVSRHAQFPGYFLFMNSPNRRGGDWPSDFDWKTVSTNAPTNVVVLDQAFVSPPNDREFRVETGFEQAQTFTVSVAGILNRLELNLKRSTATNQGDLVFDVRETSSGVPVEFSPVLVSTILPAASIATAGGFVAVEVGSLVSVTP